MTKKDYEMLARLLNTAMLQAGKKQELVKFALSLTTELERENPAFSREKFAYACTKGLVK